MMRAVLVAAGVAAALPAAAAAPAFVFEAGAKPALRSLWRASQLTRREQVACLAGRIGQDTVVIDGAEVLPEVEGDSLSASAELSLQVCSAPRFIGTAHTHIRATDDDEPARRFSADDRRVMSAWVQQQGQPGAFCVLYSERGARCEVYPPR